jgi:hypothetical protein
VCTFASRELIPSTWTCKLWHLQHMLKCSRTIFALIYL